MVKSKQHLTTKTHLQKNLLVIAWKIKNKDEIYYPQTYLKECKHQKKKREKKYLRKRSNS